MFRLDVPSGWTARLQGPDAPGGRAVAITPPTLRPLLCWSARFHCPTTRPPRCSTTAPAARLRGCSASPRRRRSGPGGSRTPIGRGFYVSVTDRRVTQPTAGRISSTASRASWSPAGCSPPSRSSPIWRAGQSASRRSRWCAPPGTNRPRCRCSTTAAPCRSRFPTGLAPAHRPAGLHLRAQAVASGARALGRRQCLHRHEPHVFLEAAAPGRTAVDYREQVWARTESTGPFIDVRRSERDGMALLERTFPGAAGCASISATSTPLSFATVSGSTSISPSRAIRRGRSAV